MTRQQRLRPRPECARCLVPLAAHEGHLCGRCWAKQAAERRAEAETVEWLRGRVFDPVAAWARRREAKERAA